MKKFLLFAFVLVRAITACGDEHFVTLKAGSEVYSNVTVTSSTATRIYFTHSRGLGDAKLKDLDSDLQRQYHYNAANAAAAELKQQQDNAAYRQIIISQAATNKSASVSSSGTYVSQSSASSGTETQVQTRSLGSRTIVVRASPPVRPLPPPRNTTIPEKSPLHSSAANNIQKSPAVALPKSAPSMPLTGVQHN